MIHPIFVSPEEVESNTCHSIFREKLNKWIDNEYSNGWLIEILRFNFYHKHSDTNQYCAIEYRARTDPEYLKIEERLRIGL